jgi:hypothetical protein
VQPRIGKTYRAAVRVGAGARLGATGLRVVSLGGWVGLTTSAGVGEGVGDGVGLAVGDDDDGGGVTGGAAAGWLPLPHAAASSRAIRANGTLTVSA